MPQTSALIALLALLMASAAQAQSGDAQLAAQGGALVANQCSRCHQIGPSGASPLPVAPPFYELMQRYPPEALEEALGEGLSSGHPAMPEFRFEPDEIAAIVAYFATLQSAR